MNTSLFVIGLAKVIFGVLVGAVGIFVGLRLLSLMMRMGKTDQAIKSGSIAYGVLQGASLLALGIHVQHAVSATFDAMDLLYRGRSWDGTMLGRFAFYALVHVSITLTIGACVLAIGAWLFNRLTRGVDEVDEVRKGNVAPAIVLGAVLVVMALVTAPGLRTALDGLLPLPILARDEVIAPGASMVQGER